MRHFSRWLSRADDGGSAVEYGLLASGVAGLVAVSVFLFGDAVHGLFDHTCDSINTAASSQAAKVSC